MSQIYIADGHVEKLLEKREVYFKAQNSDKDIGFVYLDNVDENTQHQYLISQYKDIDELGDKIDVAAVKHQMLEGQYNIMPEWMKKQLWANDIKIETMDKINPMSDSEKRLAEKWRAELKPNLKKWLAHEKTKVVKDATSSKIRVPLARLKSLGIKKKKE